MKVVVAPNAFKGTLTASQAARAIARGVREVFPDAEVVEVPVADGGDGTVEALVTANRGESLTAKVEGPLGDAVTATYGGRPRSASASCSSPHGGRTPTVSSSASEARRPMTAAPAWPRLSATGC